MCSCGVYSFTEHLKKVWAGYPAHAYRGHYKGPI